MFASVVPSLRLSALYQLFQPNRISRSTARGQLLYHWFHSLQSIVGSVCFIARGQSFHRVLTESVVLKLTVSLRISCSIARDVVSVVPLLAVGRCISRAIFRGQLLYQSIHRSRSGVVSVVPSLTAGRCISRSIAHGGELYRSQPGVVSVVPSPAVNHRIRRCIVCSLSLHLCHVAQALSVISDVPSESQTVSRCVSVVPSLAASCCATDSIARSQYSYQLFHRSWSIVVSVDPSLAVGRYISRSIARGRALYQSFQFAVGRCISRSIARDRALYQSPYRSRSGVVSVVP